MSKSTRWRVVVALACGALLAGPDAASGQRGAASPLAPFKTEALSLGLLVETAVDVQTDRTFPGANGFAVPQFRIRLEGRLEGGFSYLFQTSFGDALDARLSWRPSEQLAISAGRFKVPFSGEFMLSPVAIEFARRAQVVDALRPGRSVGVQVLVSGPWAPVEIRYGVYNSGGTPRGNAAGRFTHAVRAVASHRIGATELELGGGVAANNVERVDFDPSGLPSFLDLRRVVGLDTRIENERWLLSAEAIWATARSAGLEDPKGGQVTAGLYVRPNTLLLIRWDDFDPGAQAGPRPSDSERRRLFVLGLKAQPTEATRFRVNVQLPTSGFAKKPRLVASAQLTL